MSYRMSLLLYIYCLYVGYCQASLTESQLGTDVFQVSPLIIAAGCMSVIILILVITLCGGCTPMEVGSDQHEAAGGHAYNESSNFTTGYTNVNARVLTSGTNVANDQYNHDDNSSLPYPVRPQTDNNFTGYSTQQHGYQPQGQQQHGSHPQGYQLYGSQPSYQQQESIPGANRHIVDDSEPPPPSYNEALTHQTRNQTNATAPYGW